MKRFLITKVWSKDPKTQADLDNHSNQLNPNNDEYWHSREGN